MVQDISELEEIKEEEQYHSRGLLKKKKMM